MTGHWVTMDGDKPITPIYIRTRFLKGSVEAKEYMAKLRAKRHKREPIKNGKKVEFTTKDGKKVSFKIKGK